MDIFLTKNASLRFKRSLLSLWSRMDYFDYGWMHFLFVVVVVVLKHFATVINVED